MKAVLLLDERRNIGENRFVELVVWQVQQPLRASTHSFKYRLVFVIDGVCVLRYDNEAGKEALYTDFMADVMNWRT